MKNISIPAEINIELTTICPFRCPQCYCSLNNAKNIPLDVAKKYAFQANAMGVKMLNLSGGETLCYPFLKELIEYSKSIGIGTSIAISGWGATEEKLEELIFAGIDRIFVSLNGSTEAINSLSREGYSLAVAALQTLRNINYEEVYINWVMHNNNANDFQNMIELSKRYSVKSLIILAPKPTNIKELNTQPSQEQLRNISEIIKGLPPDLVKVETCFSQLLAMIRDTKFLGNLNTGRYRGCGAGFNIASINVDGKYSPCRHLEVFEEYSSLSDYWELSPMLNMIRTSSDLIYDGLCKSCHYQGYCRPCIATICHGTYNKNITVDDCIGYCKNSI